MIPLDADWSDVGSWDALAERADNNSSAITVDSSNCFVSTSGPEVALLGVDDLIVIATGERVVIMRRGRSQEIKQLAAASANG
jgi:mannose-1-phosphate guanylyltransferase